MRCDASAASLGESRLPRRDLMWALPVSGPATAAFGYQAGQFAGRWCSGSPAGALLAGHLLETQSRPQYDPGQAGQGEQICIS
jgi:hypothetical protein